MKYDIKVYPEDSFVHVEVNAPLSHEVPVQVPKEKPSPPLNDFDIIEVPPEGPGVVRSWKVA